MDRTPPAHDSRRSLLASAALLLLVGVMALAWAGVSYQHVQKTVEERIAWRLQASDAALGALLDSATSAGRALAAELAAGDSRAASAAQLPVQRAAGWGGSLAFDVYADGRLIGSSDTRADTGYALAELRAASQRLGPGYLRGERLLLPLWIPTTRAVDVVVSIDADLVLGQWQLLGLPPDASLALFDSRGRLALRSPPLPQMIGRDLSPVPQLGAVRAGRNDAPQAIASPVDGRLRLMQWRRLESVPGAVLLAGVPHDEVTALWWRTYGRLVLLSAALGLLLIAALVVTQRRRLRAGRTAAAARAEQAAAGQRWQFAIEGSAMGVWDWDVETGAVWYSARWKSMLGHPENEVGSTLVEWQGRIHPDDLAAAHGGLQVHLRGDTPAYESTQRLRCKDGSYKWIQARGRVLARAADGRPLRMVGTHADITDRRRIEDARRARESAERASRAKTEFLTRMSHELRTPLNAVIGFTQLLQIDPRDPASPAQRERLRHIERGAQHLLALIDDVLDLTRIDANQLPLRIERVALATAVDDALAMNASLAERMKVTVARRLPPQAWVSVDATRLQQVLINLLSNAIKYNREHGRVEIVATEVPQSVPRSWSLQVIDTGHGLHAEQLRQLFEPFNRLGAERSKIEGTGIGLLLARRLAEAMRGQLEVTSTPGVGTTVTLCLPATEPVVDPATAGAGSAVAAALPLRQRLD